MREGQRDPNNPSLLNHKSFISDWFPRPRCGSCKHSARWPPMLGGPVSVCWLLPVCTHILNSDSFEVPGTGLKGMGFWADFSRQPSQREAHRNASQLKGSRKSLCFCCSWGRLPSLCTKHEGLGGGWGLRAQPLRPGSLLQAD